MGDCHWISENFHGSEFAHTAVGAIALEHSFIQRVELIFARAGFANVISRADLGQHPPGVEHNTYWILELLERRRIHTIFIVLGWNAERCASLVRDIF
jgi:hypothetical protein